MILVNALSKITKVVDISFLFHGLFNRCMETISTHKRMILESYFIRTSRRVDEVAECSVQGPILILTATVVTPDDKLLGITIVFTRKTFHKRRCNIFSIAPSNGFMPDYSNCRLNFGTTSQWSKGLVKCHQTSGKHCRFNTWHCRKHNNFLHVCCETCTVLIVWSILVSKIVYPC